MDNAFKQLYGVVQAVIRRVNGLRVKNSWIFGDAFRTRDQRIASEDSISGFAGGASVLQTARAVRKVATGAEARGALAGHSPP